MKSTIGPDKPDVESRAELPIFITVTRESVNGRPDDQSQKFIRRHVSSRRCRETLSRRVPTKAEHASGGSISKFKLASWFERGSRKANEARKMITKKVIVVEQSDGDGRDSHESMAKDFKSQPIIKASRFLERQSWAVLGCCYRILEGSSGEEDVDVVGFSISREPPWVGPIDPFGITALPLDHHMQGLVHHYVWDYPASVHPLKFYRHHSQNFIFSMAIADQALLHTIIALSKIHKSCFGTVPALNRMEAIRLLDVDPEVLYHQMMAMKLVSEKIKADDMSDTTIAAVLLLSMHQPWIERKEGNVHYSGLKQLLHHRGGLEMISPALAAAIRFHDLKRSILNCVGPSFIEQPIQTGNFDLETRLLCTDSALRQLHGYLESFIGADLWQILCDLYDLTCFVNHYRCHSGEFGGNETSLFEVWNSSIEHRLLSYLAWSAQRASSNDNFREALCTTAILWMSTALWTWPPCTSMVMSAVDHLMKILSHSDLDSWRERFPSVLLWILVVGACCDPHEGPSRNLLLEQLRIVCLLQGLNSQPDFESSLREFIFIDGAYYTSLTLLWRDISQPILGQVSQSETFDEFQLY